MGERLHHHPGKIKTGDRSQPMQRPHAKLDGSIIVVVATDAPLLPIQLKVRPFAHFHYTIVLIFKFILICIISYQRLAKRSALGVARTGGVAHDSSGVYSIFLPFSFHALYFYFKILMTIEWLDR